MTTLVALLSASFGFALGVYMARRGEDGPGPLDPEEKRRLAALRELVRRDPDDHDPAPRVELAEIRLARGDASGAARELGLVVRRHPEVARVRAVARAVLRTMLLREGRSGSGGETQGITRLLPQDIDWRPETRRLVMRLRDLTLGGLLELRELELHLHDFEPGVNVQPFPRVVACRAVLSEERLAYLLETRIDWSRVPVRDLRIRFQDGTVRVSGSYLALGLPVGFRVAASARVAGASRLRIGFPDRPVVAGIVPLPIDTVLRALAGAMARKRPGMVEMVGEATLELELLRMGLPPVEVNLSSIEVGDGRIEVRCQLPAASGTEVAGGLGPAVLAMARHRAGAAAAPGGVSGLIAGALASAREKELASARQKAAGQVGEGKLQEALRTLRAAADGIEAVTSEAEAEVLEDLAEARMQTGTPEERGRAEKDLTRILEARPGRTRAARLFARIAVLGGDPEEGERRYRTAYRLDPFSPEPLAPLGELAAARGALELVERLEAIGSRLARTGPIPRSRQPPRETQAVLSPAGLARLDHPLVTAPTGRLLAQLQGSLTWLDPQPDPRGGEGSFWPVGEEDYPRLVRMMRNLATRLQVPALQMVVTRDPMGPFRLRGGARPWIEIPEPTLVGAGEATLAYELGRVLYLARSGRGYLLGLGEPERELLYGLLRTLGEEAAREARGGSEAPGILDRAVEDITDAVSRGWVLRDRDLDPWIPPEVRRAAFPAALAFHDQRPRYHDLLEFQLGLSASADRAGLLLSGSVEAALAGLRLVPSPLWAEVEEGGLRALSGREHQDPLAFRVAELLRFALDPQLDELEAELVEVVAAPGG